MEEQSAFAYLIKPDGSVGVDISAIPGLPADDLGYQWIRVLHATPGETPGVFADINLPEIVVDALLAPETQPRFSKLAGGILLVLRGANTQSRADPHDMVSVRLWVEPKRIISVQRRHALAIEELVECCEHGEAPPTISGFLSTLIDSLSAKVETMVMNLVEQLDDLEEESLLEGGAAAHTRLSDIRRQLIVVRRYVAPQRSALERVSLSDSPFLTDADRMHIREVSDQTVRLVDELDAARERATVINDAWVAWRAEEMNRNMLVLSIVAAVFLPLGFLTGLLGVNVGGIPGTGSPFAFWIVCGMSVALAAGLFLLFKRLRWI